MRHRLPACLLAIALGWFLFTGWYGRDLGYHGDEYYAQINPVHKSVIRGTLLPDYYIYPGLNYWINLAALAPNMIHGGISGQGPMQAALDLIDSHDYLLRLRIIRIALSSLSMIWLYLLLLRWKNAPWQALLAAALLGFSFEVAYHARWVATDILLMMLGLLNLLFALSALRSDTPRRWLYASAVAAGLSCGMKYPGGAFLLTSFITLLQRRSTFSLRTLLGHTAGLCATFGFTFLLTTPGVILQPWQFFRDLHFIVFYYKTHGHNAYTIEPGLTHLGHMLGYLGAVVPSPCIPLAIALALFAPVGIASIARNHRHFAPLLLAFPLLYLLYFSTQRIFIVRNTAALFPFLFLYIAEGIHLASRLLPKRGLRITLHAAVTAAIIFHAAYLLWAAQTIRDRYTERYLHRAMAYVANHPNRTFLLSRQLTTDLNRLEIPIPNNTTETIDNADEFAFFVFDAQPRPNIPTRFFRLSQRDFGPREINFTRYPSWRGNDRLLFMTRQQLLRATLDPQAIATHSHLDTKPPEP